MTEKAAKETLKILAKGINPITGEGLPGQSCFNKAEVIRELFELLDTSNKKRCLPRNQGTPWTKELKQELDELYSEGKPINELANHFGRGVGAINSELKHQGLKS